jgi:hypothetical protein
MPRVLVVAPATADGGFQLWTVGATPSTAPTPVAISSTLDLDATSAPVWVS